MEMEKIMEDCFEAIRRGVVDKDRKKMWRGFFRLKNLIIALIGETSDTDDPDTIS